MLLLKAWRRVEGCNHIEPREAISVEANGTFMLFSTWSLCLVDPHCIHHRSPSFIVAQVVVMVRVI